jgi:hypothetical protein
MFLKDHIDRQTAGRDDGKTEILYQFDYARGAIYSVPK